MLDPLVNWLELGVEGVEVESLGVAIGGRTRFTGALVGGVVTIQSSSSPHAPNNNEVASKAEAAKPPAPFKRWRALLPPINFCCSE